MNSNLTLPDFIVVGAMKCATTSLCYALSRHENIYICEPKEPEFFNRDQEYRQGISQYSRLFESADNGMICGEGSTSYSKCGLFPRASERLAEHLPNVKLIYIMRDPIRRIESHWMHTARNNPGFDTPFLDSIVGDANYVDTSCYWRQYLHLRKHFPPDQFLLLLFEDFKSNPKEVTRQCLKFIGVDNQDYQRHEPEHQHKSVGSVIDRPIVGKLQNSELIRSVFQLLPRYLRDQLKRPFQRTISSRPQWNPDALRRTLDTVGPDAQKMPAHLNRQGVWSLDESHYLEADSAENA